MEGSARVHAIVSSLSTAFAQLILMPGYGDSRGYIGTNVHP